MTITNNRYYDLLKKTPSCEVQKYQNRNGM